MSGSQRDAKAVRLFLKSSMESQSDDPVLDVQIITKRL